MISLKLRDELEKIRKDLGKYSQMELRAGGHRATLSKILSECTCDPRRQFPLDPSHYIGSLGERLAASRDEEFRNLRVELQELRRRTFAAKEMGESMVFPESVSWRVDVLKLMEEFGLKL